MYAAAEPRHDWVLLVVLMAVELDKSPPRKLRELLVKTSNGVERIDKGLVLKRCEQAQHHGLKVLLDELIQLAWPSPATTGT